MRADDWVGLVGVEPMGRTQEEGTIWLMAAVKSN